MSGDEVINAEGEPRAGDAAATQDPAGTSPTLTELAPATATTSQLEAEIAESDWSATAREALAAAGTTISTDEAPVTAPMAHMTKTVHGDAASTTQPGEGGSDETPTCDSDTMTTMDAEQSSDPHAATPLDVPKVVVPRNIEDDQLVARVIVELVDDLIAWRVPGIA
jgi:hypothetical protein